MENKVRKRKKAYSLCDMNVCAPFRLTVKKKVIRCTGDEYRVTKINQVEESRLHFFITSSTSRKKGESKEKEKRMSNPRNFMGTMF